MSETIVRFLVAVLYEEDRHPHIINGIDEIVLSVVVLLLVH